MTCLTCQHATTKSPTGGTSAHRNAMAALGYTGCKLDNVEAKSFSIDHKCDKWTQASAEQMARRQR